MEQSRDLYRERHIFRVEILWYYHALKYTQQLSPTNILTDSQSAIKALLSSEKNIYKISPHVINIFYAFNILIKRTVHITFIQGHEYSTKHNFTDKLGGEKFNWTGKR